MTLEQLRTFLWVARLGGMRKAAARLNLSQPALSARVAALEAELGRDLFERRPGGLVLTAHGRALTGYVEQMLFVEEEIRAHVADPSEMRGLFRIGASETIAQSWLPAFIKRVSAVYPRVTLDLMVDISVNLRASLLERQLDLAILMGPISDFSVENVALPPFELDWFRAPAEGATDLAAVPVISYASQTRPYRELSAALARRHGPGARIYSSASLSAALRMIAEGVAVGPYPRLLARPLLDEGAIESFDPGLPVSPLTFTASYAAEPRSHVAETAARIAAEVAEDWHGARESGDRPD